MTAPDRGSFTLANSRFCKKKNSIRSAGIKPYETCRSDQVTCRWKISMVKSAVPFTLIQRITRERKFHAGECSARKDGIDKLPSAAKCIVANTT